MEKQKRTEKKMDTQAVMEVYNKLATPGAPHKMLSRLAGSWTTKPLAGRTKSTRRNREIRFRNQHVCRA